MLNIIISRHLRLVVGIVGLYIISVSQSLAQSAAPVIHYILPDLGSPGMSTYIEIIGTDFGPEGVYANNPNDAVRLEPVYSSATKDKNKVFISPLVVSWSNSNGSGRLISAQIFVRSDVQATTHDWREVPDTLIIELKLTVFGQQAVAVRSVPVKFYIVKPWKMGDITGKGTVFGAGQLGLRSPRGVMLVDSLTLQKGLTYTVSTADCDPKEDGEQGYLPFVLLSKGKISGNGATIDVSAQGIHGGPGGGGGGGRVCDETPLSENFGNDATPGGNGFTGGSSGGVNRKANFLGPKSPVWKGGGKGSGSSPPDNSSRTKEIVDGGRALNNLGGGTGIVIESPIQQPSDPQSAGGGTGHPFGLSGLSWDDNTLPYQELPVRYPGYGGGTGGLEVSGYPGKNNGQQGDAGGYGQPGYSAYRSLIFKMNGGEINGNKMVVPIAGGSGGGSGNPSGSLSGGCGGAGGGGGGAIRIYGYQIENLTVVANGGNASGGGETGSTTPDGGGGSGGHIGIHSKLPTKGIKTTVYGGTNQGNGSLGRGGYGRVRYDIPSASAIPDTDPGADSTGDSNQYYGIVSDTNSTVISPYTVDVQMQGSHDGSVGNFRVYWRSASANSEWKALSEDFEGSKTSGIPYWETKNVIKNNTDKDSVFYFVVLREIVNPQSAAFTKEPQWIMSQAATNIKVVEPLPLITTGTVAVNFEPVKSCGDPISEKTKPITIENARGGLLKISEMRFAGGTAKGFTLLNLPFISPDIPLRINGNSKRTFDVQFSPDKVVSLPLGKEEVILDTLIIVHNDSIPDIVQVRPNVWEPQIRPGQGTLKIPLSVKLTRHVFQITVEPKDKIDFGGTTIGTTLTRFITVKNTGTTVATVVISGTPMSPYGLQLPPNMNLQPDSSIQIPIIFTPVERNKKTGRIIINADGFNECENQGKNFADIRVDFEGSGEAPELDTAKSTKALTLGIVRRCYPDTSAIVINDVQIASVGESSLTISNLQFVDKQGNPSPYFSVVQANTIVIPPNIRPYTLPITFQPPLTRMPLVNYETTLEMNTNDGREQFKVWRVPITIPLETKIAELEPTPQSVINFDTVYFNKSTKTLTLSLKNTGNLPIILRQKPDSVLLYPFALESRGLTFPLTIQPKSQTDFTFRFIATKPDGIVQSGVELTRKMRLDFLPQPADVCAAFQRDFTLRVVPIQPPARQVAFWLDTLHAVDPARDTVLHLYARVEPNIAADTTETDNLTANIRVSPGLLYPRSIQPRVPGTAMLEDNRRINNDRYFTVNVRDTRLNNGVQTIAAISFTPIIGSTTTAIAFLDSVRWAKADISPYRSAALLGGKLTLTMCNELPPPKLLSAVSIQLTVFPNPVLDALTMRYIIPIPGTYSVSLMNVLGEIKPITEWTEPIEITTERERNVQIPPDIAVGFYRLLVRTPAGLSSTLVLISR